MNLIFWQNVVSIHQLSFLIELSKHNNINQVILIVPELLSIDRKKLGWEEKIYESEKFHTFILSKDNKQISDIFKKYNKNSFHFFSGFKAFPFVFEAFKVSLKYDVFRGIITESPFFYKKPPFLHFLYHTVFIKYKYQNYIHCIYAIGSDACKWYSKLYRKPIFNFKYVTHNPLDSFIETNNKDKIKLIFIGNFINRKNIESIIYALHSLKNKIKYELHLVGDGPLANKIKKLTIEFKLQEIVFFSGVIPNNNIFKYLTKFDVLILPSFFDGWGAVVNEALQCGLFVIVSNRCGSKDLIDNNFERGIIINPDKNSLIKALEYVEDNIEQIRDTRYNRINWAKQHISPQAIASEFLINLKKVTNI